MIFLRARRSDLIHVSFNGRVTACNRKCQGWLAALEEAVTCAACIRVVQDIETNGN